MYPNILYSFALHNTSLVKDYFPSNVTKEDELKVQPDGIDVGNIIFPINHSPFMARCIYGTLCVLFKIQVGSSGRNINDAYLVARPVSFIPLNSINSIGILSFPYSVYYVLIIISRWISGLPTNKLHVQMLSFSCLTKTLQIQ